MNDIRAAWEQTISKLETKMPATSVQRFLKPLVPASFDGNTAEFHAPGRFVKEWVEDRYLDIVTQNLSDSLEMEVRIEIQVKPNEHPGRASKTAGAVSVQSESSLEAPSAGPSFQPNPRYRFETFVVGQSSRLAYAGCKAVAEKPAQKYNPLFIYGPSGLGKTHLLHSIANEILMRDPNYPVMYISAQQFTEDFIHALQNNRIEARITLRKSCSTLSTTFSSSASRSFCAPTARPAISC